MGCEGSDEILTLSPLNVMVFGAARKQSGYRGPKKFITAMKQLHTGEGYAWDSQLAQAQHRFNVSTTRGLGPARQSEPLPFEKVAELKLNDDAVGPKMPANPASVITAS